MWGLGPLWSADNTGLPVELQKEIEEWLDLYKDGLVHGTMPDDEEYWADIFDCDHDNLRCLVFEALHLPWADRVRCLLFFTPAASTCSMATFMRQAY